MHAGLHAGRHAAQITPARISTRTVTLGRPSVTLALLTAAFARQAAAAVSVGTYSPWEPTATLRSGAVGSAARGASAPTEGGERLGYIVAAPAQLVETVITARRRIMFTKIK